MRTINSLIVFSAIALASACGGSSSGSGSGSGGAAANNGATAGPVSEAQFQDQAPDLFCQALQTCCNEAGLQHNPFFCAAFTGANGSEPGLTYDAAAAGACLQQLRGGMQCQASDMAFACDRVYTGNKQPGEGCGSDAECALPAGGEGECDLFDEVCVAVRRGEEGDACNASCQELTPGGYSCSLFDNTALSNEEVRCFREDGLTCGAEQLCQALAELGETCVSNSDCVDGSYCPFDAMARVCAPKLMVGEACQAFSQDCVDSAFCGDTGMCEAKKPNGQACMQSHECQGSCTDMVCADGDLLTGFLGLVCIP